MSATEARTRAIRRDGARRMAPWLALMAALTLPINSAAAANLAIGVAAETTSIDPHFQSLTANHEIRRHIFEGLVAVGPNNDLRPELATSWRLTADPQVWEFRLRPGVRFHDGTKLTARDVAFSLTRAFGIPGGTANFRRFVEDVAEAVAIDDLTLRVRTRTLAPLLPASLALIGVVPEKLGPLLSGSAFNDPAVALGSGPYRLVEAVPGSHVKLRAVPDHWSGPPAWDEVTFKLLSNSGARVAALLAGDVDAIADVPTTHAASLVKDDRVAVVQGPSHRVLLWAMDVFREKTPFITAKDGSPIANPLRDRRVREALSLAIDRQAIVGRVMEGLAIGTNQIIPSGFSGHDADAPLPRPDLARARALMAEAGYGDGFRLTLHATSNRYVNDAKLAQTMAQMLARIGVEAGVNAMPVAIYYGPARKFEFSMNLVGWGHPSGDAMTVMREALRTGSINNYGRWSNAEYDALLDRAERDMDLARRGQLLQQAQRIATADVALLPTHFQVNIWATRRGLRIEPRIDELTLAMSVSQR
ncbi:MAG: ABC transporter substrate-binding protein [Proteobacteria bacterium]|nr:ABC transporter substrate-binding protein [Pseudomonadota bacterium]